MGYSEIANQHSLSARCSISRKFVSSGASVTGTRIFGFHVDGLAGTDVDLALGGNDLRTGSSGACSPKGDIRKFAQYQSALPDAGNNLVVDRRRRAGT